MTSFKVASKFTDFSQGGVFGYPRIVLHGCGTTVHSTTFVFLSSLSFACVIVVIVAVHWPMMVCIAI